MASRLRSSSGLKISFFAFQDIITSVTGILILVTLILSLYLTKGGPGENDAQSPEREKLRKIEGQLSEVTERNRLLQAALNQAQAAPRPERVQSDIEYLISKREGLKKSFEQLRFQLVAEKEKQEAADRAFGIAELQERLKGEEAKLAGMKISNEVAQSELEKIEASVTNLQARIDHVNRENNKVWVLPGNHPDNIQPILVSVSREGIKCEKFGAPAPIFAGTQNEALIKFPELLNLWDARTTLLVFFVRPSGVPLFRVLSQASREAGFKPGYDALEENMELIFKPLGEE